MAKAQTLQKHPLDRPWRVLLWGPPGSWKTVRAHTWPATRTLDFDDGMLSVLWAIKAGVIKKDPSEIIYATIREREEKKERGPHGFVKKPGALDRATDQIDEWLEDDSWQTLIVDSGTSLNWFCMLKGVQAMGEFGYSKSWKKALMHNVLIPRIQDYGGSKNMFEQFVAWVLSIDRNVIMVCHEFEDTTDSGLVRQYQPLLIGSLRQAIPMAFDEVWHSYIDTDKEGKRVGMIRTVTDKKHMAKSRLGCLDAEESAFSYDEIVAKVNKFWGKNG